MAKRSSPLPAVLVALVVIGGLLTAAWALWLRDPGKGGAARTVMGAS